MKIYPFSHILEDIGNSSQSEYLRDYLTDLKAKTVVIEDDYIDKDYLLDYSNYYARSFEPHDRFTKRLHIFSESFSIDEFDKLFSYDENFLSLLNDSYLGFIVVKPIRDPVQNEPFIGRTILKTYEEHDGDEHRNFITNSNSISLFGFPLIVESLPFQTQDNIVSKCATTAIWVSLFALNALFGTQKSSPFEITQRSVSFPGLDRNFPSSGLNIFQMKDYFNSLGMDTEFINVEKAPDYVRKQIVSDAVKSYLSLGLPAIACIQLRGKSEYPDLHAVVISGYRYDNNGNLKELYVHDDQIGPYSKVFPKYDDGDFSFWTNEWITKYGYEEIFVEKLLIPIYPKIRLSFNKLYKVFLDIKNTGQKAELFLREIKSYKNWLLQKSFRDKSDTLTQKAPRFIWVIRIGDRNSPELDILYDAISTSIEPYQIIDFD